MDRSVDFPDYKLGIHIIDEQHRIFFELVKILKQDIQNRGIDCQNTRNVIKGIKDYVETHFVTEEEILRIYGYPEYERQVELHDSFTLKVYELEKEVINNNCEQGEKLVEFLENWFLDHILVEDKKYVDFLEKAGVKQI